MNIDQRSDFGIVGINVSFHGEVSTFLELYVFHTLMNIKYRRGTFSKYEMLPVRGKILYILRQSFAARVIIFYSPVNIKYR